MSFFSRFFGKDDVDKKNVPAPASAPAAAPVAVPADVDCYAALSMHLRGEVEQALAAYESIAGRNPEEKVPLFFAAAIMAGKGGVVEAAEALRTLSRDIAQGGEGISRAVAVELVEIVGDALLTVKYPAVADLVVSFGDLLKEKGFLRESAVCFEIASGLVPDNAHMLHKLGDTLHDLRAYDYAETVLQEALKHAPNHWGSLYTYASLLQDLGRHEEAIGYYHQAVKLDPTHAKCQNNYGAALLKVGRVEEALAHCTEAEKLDPAAPLVKNNLGYIHMLRQDYESARSCFTEATALSEKLFPAYFGLASAEEALNGDPKRIQDLYLKAIEINPTSAEIHHALARYLAGQGDKQALLHFSTAAVLNGDLQGLHKDYGFACQQLGRPEQALEQFKMALQQNPGDAQVQEVIAKAEAKA